MTWEQHRKESEDWLASLPSDAKTAQFRGRTYELCVQTEAEWDGTPSRVCTGCAFDPAGLPAGCSEFNELRAACETAPRCWAPDSVMGAYVFKPAKE